MKRILVSSIVFGALVAGSAMAADMPAKAPLLMKAPPPAYSWTGCYLSGGIGYGLWNQDHSATTGVGGVPNGNTIEITDGGRGWLGRLGGGCDYQLSGTFSSFVIGVLGDYDFANLKGSIATLVDNGGGATLVADEKESAAWAAGLRIGYLVAPNVLTYVNGGWTQARFDQFNLTNRLGVASVGSFPANTYQGWFIGSGVEYSISFLPFQGLFWRSEYRYGTYKQADLTAFNSLTGAPFGNGGLGDVLHSKKQVQTVTSSLVWRFNWFH